jgi:hypothetical protein
MQTPVTPKPPKPPKNTRTPKTPATVVPPLPAAPSFWMTGDLATVRLAGQVTGGVLSLVERFVAPHGGPRPTTTGGRTRRATSTTAR